MVRTMLVVWSLTVAVAGAGESMSVSDLLDRYEATMAKMRAYSDQGVLTAEYTSLDGTKQWARYENTCFIDGDRMHWSCLEWKKLQSKDQDVCPEDGTRRVYLWNGQSSYEYYNQKGFDPRLIVGADDRVRVGMFAIGYGGAPLMGVLDGDEDMHVNAIVRQAQTASVRLGRERIGDSLCHVVEATGDYGHYTVWFDPEHDYHIARAQVHKQAGDKYMGDRRLDWVYQGGNNANYKGRKQDPRQEYRSVLRNVRFEKVGGSWVPMEADRDLTTKYGDNTTRSSQMHYKRVAFEIDPDFKANGAFVPDFPDGTPTWVIEAPGAIYRWRDGKPELTGEQR